MGVLGGQKYTQTLKEIKLRRKLKTHHSEYCIFHNVSFLLLYGLKAKLCLWTFHLKKYKNFPAVIWPTPLFLRKGATPIGSTITLAAVLAGKRLECCKLY